MNKKPHVRQERQAISPENDDLLVIENVNHDGAMYLKGDAIKSGVLPEIFTISK